MMVLEISSRPDRHADLLAAAEAVGQRALICFERGREANLLRGNELAAGISAESGGDIGWQIIDVGIMLTRHAKSLKPTARAHLELLLEEALEAWHDREFGRGNVNHPVVATWLYAAAGVALQRSDYTLIADERLRRFIHIFSQVGDMSEYNSPTYLGPTLVGLANIGTHAAWASTRLRARLIEERIWLSTVARWHAPTQQLAGPHSRAYADNTLGFAGIFRYLAHAVLSEPVFWDLKLAMDYDHHYEAEWAARIAATTFGFPEYLQMIAERKSFPYTVESITDGEDYTVDGREVYRGGRGSLSTFMTARYCLGTAERPYVDAGQTESCIAYWQRRDPVEGINDLRVLYFRYVANERLPGQTNTYHNWYGGKAEMTYGPNLLHQDGRLHTLQHRGKAIVLAQPVRRENGYIRSLRFDALMPLFTELDEIWVAGQRLTALPIRVDWQSTITLRDGEVFIALLPLQPTDLGGADRALQISEINDHLIISLYNLRGDEPRTFANHILDGTHNGMAIEVGTTQEYGDFTTFRRHIARTSLEEHLWLGEVREVRYRSTPDELYLRYNPFTQEVLARQINGLPVAPVTFHCPNACQGTDGWLQVHSASLATTPGVPVWLAHEPTTGWTVAGFPTDLQSSFRLTTGATVVEGEGFGPGRLCLRTTPSAEIEVDTLSVGPGLRIRGSPGIERVVLNGKDARMDTRIGEWLLL